MDWKRISLHRVRLGLAALVLLAIPFVSFQANAAPARPFSSTSAWNVTVPSTAKYAKKAIASGFHVGFDIWDPSNDWVVPYYVARTTDPAVPLLYNPDAWYNVFNGRWKRYGNSAAVEDEIRAGSLEKFPHKGNVFSTTSATSWVMPVLYNALTNPTSGAARFHVASRMRPAPGADGHVAIKQPNGKVLEIYSTILLSDGTVVALSYSVTDPKGKGDGWQRGQTASMLPSYAGALRRTDKINHALAITVPPALLKTGAAYPAFAFDRDAITNDSPYQGPLPMGTRLSIPRGVKIASLKLSTSTGKAIARAAKRHGFIIVDRGGSGITIRAYPGIKDPAVRSYSHAVSSDLAKIFKRVRRVNFPIYTGL
jgi:hypothetical protein